MNREVRLLRQATVDVAKAQRFYERQSSGLGRYFRDAVNADLRSLLISGGVHRVVHGLHRCPTKRFPYAIFYRVEDDIVHIYAVLDCRRNPDDLRRRLLGER